MAIKFSKLKVRAKLFIPSDDFADCEEENKAFDCKSMNLHARTVVTEYWLTGHIRSGAEYHEQKKKDMILLEEKKRK